MRMEIAEGTNRQSNKEWIMAGIAGFIHWEPLSPLIS